MITRFLFQLVFIFVTIAAQAASDGNVAMHPVQAAKGIANAVMHPVQTSKAIYQEVKEKAATSQGRGELAFDVATALLSYIKIGKAAKIANAVDNVSDTAGASKTIVNAGKQAAKNTDNTVPKCPTSSSQCFTAGTQIVVGEVYDEETCSIIYTTINIEDIKVGDLVYSYDTITGEVSQREVTATFVRESDHLDYLTIVDADGNEQVIETTDSHPFWVVTDSPDLSRAASEIVVENGTTLYHENLGVSANGYWVEAKDLRIGDVFIGANGELSTLVAQERVTFADGIKVYNFTVDGNHDYFVIAQTAEYGQTCILVHNANEKLYRQNISPESPARLERKSLEAESNPNCGIHGVSVSATENPTIPCSSADRSNIEKYFTVHDTPTTSDPLHRTVELPKPVTKKLKLLLM
ncbi:hypothetical protein FACS189427_03200 [Planctomycetales bacterium]|nr:hypothetical protein FACS189427_03200 [Planctomycetales bacterium]